MKQKRAIITHYVRDICLIGLYIVPIWSIVMNLPVHRRAWFVLIYAVLIIIVKYAFVLGYSRANRLVGDLPPDGQVVWLIWVVTHYDMEGVNTHLTNLTVKYPAIWLGLYFAFESMIKERSSVDIRTGRLVLSACISFGAGYALWLHGPFLPNPVKGLLAYVCVLNAVFIFQSRMSKRVLHRAR